MVPDAMDYWTRYADWTILPHIQHFESIADLMRQLVDSDFHRIASDMKRFNEFRLVRTTRQWSRLFGGAFAQ